MSTKLRCSSVCKVLGRFWAVANETPTTSRGHKNSLIQLHCLQLSLRFAYICEGFVN